MTEGYTDICLSALNLTEMPDELLGAKNALRDLDLSINKIAAFPTSLQLFNCLQKLQLYGNQIEMLPSDIGKLERLEELQLNGNLLENLPSQIGHCRGLEKLEICNNRLRSLPAQIGCLTNLTELRLSGNPLTELPQTIGHCQNLEVRLQLSLFILQRIPSSLLPFVAFHTYYIFQSMPRRLALPSSFSSHFSPTNSSFPPRR